LVNPTGFGIYIHWPFCLSKCPYCDFNSHEFAAIDQNRWRNALLTELDWYAPQASGQTVTSVFFGGGTPSLMDPGTVAALLERIAQHFTLSPALEVTLEANPSTVEAQRFQDFKAAGINRLSMGIQALNDADLKFLGRRHDVAEALLAIEIAGKTFDRYSFDLIYARPGQTVSDWQKELTQALELCGDHLSVYQLTIEDGTAFAPRYQRGEFHLPQENIQADLFSVTHQILTDAGMPAYEISNHARPGQECHHNLTYWLGGDYLGIGPGAHGRLWTKATRQHRAPDIWLDRVEKDGHGSHEALELTALERAEEMVMTGLRLTRGIHRGLFKLTSGLDLDSLMDQKSLSDLIEDGFIADDPVSLKVTDSGRLLLNAVTAKLLG
jgi:oxygen-independent coproporphyrinogen-3 oxidase